MNRSILITGATGKLGKIFVRFFLNKGDEVIALSKTGYKLANLAANNDDFHNKIHSIELDLMEEKSSDNLIKILNEKNLNPTCLVNNARSLENIKIDDKILISEESFLNEYKLGVIVPYLLISKLINMKNSKLKNIANISSIYGNVVPNLNLYDSPNDIPPLHYGLAKSSLIKLTKELAVRYSKRKININCISYGGLEGRVEKEFLEKYSNLCPSGKMLDEKDICNPLDFLLSNENNSINGQNLLIDGGWTLW